MRRKKNRKAFSFRRLSVFLLFFITVCFASVMSLAADDIEVTVIDGDNKAVVSVPRASERAILSKAKSKNIPKLEEYDMGILSENGSVYTIYRGTDVSVSDNAENYSFKMQSYMLTEESIINECISRYNISPVDNDDFVEYSEANRKVTIKRGFSFPFLINGSAQQEASYFGETVKEFLERSKIELSPNDKLSLSKNAVLSADSSLSLEKRAKITIVADGETKEHIVPLSSVKDALSNLGVSLSDEDIVNRELSELVNDEMTLEIKRVVYKEVTEEETIDYDIIEKEDASMTVGTVSVEQYGEEGIKEIKKKQKFIDGELADEEILSEETVKAPVDKIVRVGTKAATGAITTDYTPGTLVDYNGNTISYSYYHTGKCAAYTGGTHTSIGLPVGKGIVAVNPNLIPYGTKLYIASADGSFVYGYAVAGDTGGAFVSGNYLVDCYYETLAECYNFGIRKLNVYVLS